MLMFAVIPMRHEFTQFCRGIPGILKTYRGIILQNRKTQLKKGSKHFITKIIHITTGFVAIRIHCCMRSEFAIRKPKITFFFFVVVFFSFFLHFVL